MLGVGGSSGILALWDTSENEGVERKFASRSNSVGSTANSLAELNLTSSFKSAYDLGEELAREEEAAKLAKGGEDSKKSKKKKGKK